MQVCIEGAAKVKSRASPRDSRRGPTTLPQSTSNFDSTKKPLNHHSSISHLVSSNLPQGSDVVTVATGVKRNTKRTTLLVNGLRKKKKDNFSPPPSLQPCVFHGTTRFICLKAKRQGLSSYFKPCLPNGLECEKCCMALENFLSAAPKHGCLICRIDYPSQHRPISPESSSHHLAPRKKSQRSSVSVLGVVSLDEFRVLAVCQSSHKFLLTEAHLRQDTWCPICPLRHELWHPWPHPVEPFIAGQKSKTRELQKKLLNDARREFLKVLHSPPLHSTQNEPLPPRFFPPLQKNVSMHPNASTRIHSDIGQSHGTPDPRREKMMASMALREMYRYKCMTYPQALAIVRILYDSSDPRSVLQIQDKSNAKDAHMAYRSLARQVHPDKNPHPEAKHVFHIVQSAWQSIVESSTKRTRTGPI